MQELINGFQNSEKYYKKMKRLKPKILKLDIPKNFVQIKYLLSKFFFYFYFFG